MRGMMMEEETIDDYHPTLLKIQNRFISNMTELHSFFSFLNDLTPALKDFSFAIDCSNM